MLDFFNHPIWSFLGTVSGIFAVIISWITISENKKMKARKKLENALKKIGPWLLAIVAVVAFTAGNMAGAKSESIANTQMTNFLTVLISFIFVVVLLELAAIIKRRLLMNERPPSKQKV